MIAETRRQKESYQEKMWRAIESVRERKRGKDKLIQCYTRNHLLACVSHFLSTRRVFIAFAIEGEREKLEKEKDRQQRERERRGDVLLLLCAGERAQVCVYVCCVCVSGDGTSASCRLNGSG